MRQKRVKKATKIQESFKDAIRCSISKALSIEFMRSVLPFMKDYYLSNELSGGKLLVGKKEELNELIVFAQNAVDAYDRKEKTKR